MLRVDVTEQEAFADEGTGQLGADQAVAPRCARRRRRSPRTRWPARLIRRVPQGEVHGRRPSWVSAISSTPRSTVTPSDCRRSASTRSVSVCAVVNVNGKALSTLTERDAEELAVPGVHLHRGRLDPGGHHLVDDAHPVEHVQAAGVHRDRAGLVGGWANLSITRTPTPRRASSQPATRPTGPAPTTMTSVVGWRCSCCSYFTVC